MAALASIVAGFLLNSGGFSPPVDTALVEDRSFGSFENAVRIAFDVRGRMCVVDKGAHAIAIFTPRLDLIRTIGGYGWDATSFDRPSAVVSDGLNLYVADFGNHRISRFDRSLTPLATLQTRDTSFAAARFGYPLGLALSRHGDLYLLDGDNLRVVQFDSRSKFLRSFGGMESGEGRLRDPVEILVTSSDRLLVLESDRILEFDYAGNFVKTFGLSLLSGAQGFGETQKGVVVVSSDRIWFFDTKGSLERLITSDLILSRPLTGFKDVAVRNEFLFLLLSNEVASFRIVDVEPR